MHKLTIELIAPEESQGLRLDKWLNQQLSDCSRKYIQDAIQTQSIMVNDQAKPQKYIIQENDRITGHVLMPASDHVTAQNIPLDVVFEDEHVIVINKPAGVVTHPGHGNPDQTLLNGLLHHCPDNIHLPKHGLIHRLDKNTSGLLICAKSQAAYQKLVAMMQAREISRQYDALCWRQPPQISGTIGTLIGRHPSQRTKMSVVVGQGKTAITHYELKDVYPMGCYVRFILETGRTHQIRVHAAYLKFPIIGDDVYQSKQWQRNKKTKKSIHTITPINRQALHAQKLSFKHPITEKLLTFESPWPADMTALQLELKQDDH